MNPDDAACAGWSDAKAHCRVLRDPAVPGGPLRACRTSADQFETREEIGNLLRRGFRRI